jgi:hypothetical protein
MSSYLSTGEDVLHPHEWYEIAWHRLNCRAERKFVIESLCFLLQYVETWFHRIPITKHHFLFVSQAQGVRELEDTRDHDPRRWAVCLNSTCESLFQEKDRTQLSLCECSFLSMLKPRIFFLTSIALQMKRNPSEILNFYCLIDCYNHRPASLLRLWKEGWMDGANLPVPEPDWFRGRTSSRRVPLWVRLSCRIVPDGSRAGQLDRSFTSGLILFFLKISPILAAMISKGACLSILHGSQRSKCSLAIRNY